MDEPIHLKSAGAIWYHTDDYHSPNLTQASLGRFFYHTLRAGAHIGRVWSFNHKFDRSGVYISVFMIEKMKEEIEEKTKYRFRLPPKIKLA